MAPRIVYDIDERPPLREALPLGLQHLVAMLLGNITPPLLIALALGLAGDDTTRLIQTALVMSGLATLVQAYPLGPIGGRLPIVMGTSVVFMGAIIAIGHQYNLATAIGACLVAAPIELVMALGIVRARELFPPLVSAIIVMLIGLTLIPIGIDYAAGGVGAEDYGAPEHIGLAALVLLITVVLNQRTRGFLSYGSILVAALVGYAVAIALGRVDLSAVGDAGWVALPSPVPFGLELHWGPILLMVIIYLVSAVETIGDITAVMVAAGREPTTRELKGGLIADGAMSAFAALFGGFPNTSYSQNAGLVNFTGIVSRHVTAVTGVMLVVLGLVPKVSAAFAAIPPAVVGGAGLVMFAMIFASGIAIIGRSVELTQRNMVILAVAVGLGLGVELRPDALQHLPQWAQTFLGSGLVTGGAAGAVMNLLFPDQEP